jgi:hypothetical protein
LLNFDTVCVGPAPSGPGPAHYRVGSWAGVSWRSRWSGTSYWNCESLARNNIICVGLYYLNAGLTEMVIHTCTCTHNYAWNSIGLSSTTCTYHTNSKPKGWSGKPLILAKGKATYIYMYMYVPSLLGKINCIMLTSAHITELLPVEAPKLLHIQTSLFVQLSNNYRLPPHSSTMPLQ